MPFEFKFPDVGEGIEEGEIVKWDVKEGDSIKVDQVIGKVETDKAVVDIPAPRAGKILKILVKAGHKIKVGQIMLIIGEKGERYTKLEQKEVTEKKTETKKAYGVVGELEVAPESEVLAMPRTRKIAEELGIDIRKSKGFVREEDLTKKPTIKKKYDDYGHIERVPLKGIRKTIAENMVRSAGGVPQVTAMEDIDVSKLWKLREKEKKSMEKKGVKLTFLPFVIKAVVTALKENPILNSTLEGDEIIIKKYFNIGIATETKVGLMVPVIKIAENKSIIQLAKEIVKLAESARSRKIDIMNLKGGTFTITNYGSVGGNYGTPIINPPEAAILGLGRIFDRVVYEEKTCKTINVKILPISLTFDHRILDGAQAARFLESLKRFLEDPDHFLEERKRK